MCAMNGSLYSSGGSEGDHSPTAQGVPQHQLDPQHLAALAASLHAGGASTSSGSSGPTPAHPNVFVRGLPLAWGEAEITAVFSQFAVSGLTSIRLVRHSVTKHSLGYGFVRFCGIGEAQAAISALDGTTVLGHTLQVKFADADAGPPSSAAPSGLTPSDSCYVKHLPASYGVQEVQQLFETHGAVLDVKLFPCLDQFRGASALVRMASLEAADRGITCLNNTTPPGGVQSLIVRYAESTGEKAARLSRREAKNMQRAGSAGLPPMGALQGGGGMGLGADQLSHALNALNLGGMAGLAGLSSAAGLGGGIPLHHVPPAPLVPQAYQPQVQSSICVKGMPPNADRLWCYENFSRFGAVAGLRILIDEASGLCNGTGFVNYADLNAAERARQCMNGMRAGDRILHVIVQTNGRHMANGNSAAAPPPQNSGVSSPNLSPFLAAQGLGPSMAHAADQWQQLLPASAPLMW